MTKYGIVTWRKMEEVIKYLGCVSINALVHRDANHVRITMINREYSSDKHKRFFVYPTTWLQYIKYGKAKE